MIGLLDTSIERINSLRSFYEQVSKSLKRGTENKINENRFGYLLDYYFVVLTSNNRKELKKDSFKRLQEYFYKYIEIIEPIENGKVIFQYKNIDTLKKANVNFNIKEAAALFRQYSDMNVTHGNNTLIMLLIRFEEFIAEIFRTLFDMFPQKYLDGQNILYSEIQNKGLKDIKKTILDRKVEEVMRDSYTKWFEMLSYHKIILDSCELQLQTLKEIYARRNIIVHNGGRINNIYIKNSGVADVKIGDYVGADKKYLETAFDCVKTIMFTIVIQCSKFFKDEEKMYLEEVFSIAFTELSHKNYASSKNAFYLLMNHPHFSEEFKKMSRINFWIATKEIGTEDISGDVEAFDVSSLENRFKIAKLILLKKYKEATSLIEEEINNGHFTPDMLEWPLFSHYSKSIHCTKVKNNHQDIFGKSVVDVKDQKPEDIKVAGSSIKEDVEESQKTV